MQPLQNVLSISTAGKNRYLLHFNSLHSLTQWTAGIRLAMFEHASLQELYTGSLIAGKGKHLNNIRIIMERTKHRTEDWARVRFGAGTPWRRCWCVIEPPDEKEWQKSVKSYKKKSVYDRPLLPKGDIKFYDTKKTKKSVPIATITDAYSAYAIYPQSKPLIDQSTLVKVEGRITIHSRPESKTEGFVFVMPEVHPAVSGFEMMLRWLFPVYDAFHLYGRPNRLIAETWDARGLMFAMPKDRRYGYLDIIDVAALIHTEGSDKWSEREWRKQMKDVVAKRMSMTTESRSSSNLDNRRPTRNSVHYEDNASIHSTPSSPRHQESTDAVFAMSRNAGPAPPSAAAPISAQNARARSTSDSVTHLSPVQNRRQKDGYVPSRLSMEQDHSTESVEANAGGGDGPLSAPAPPPHRPRNTNGTDGDSRYSSDSEGQGPRHNTDDVDLREQLPPAPVAAPPGFQHQSGSRPQKRPDARSDLRREKSRMSNATLLEMVDASRRANGGTAGRAAAVAWNNGRQNEDPGFRGVNHTTPQDEKISANHGASKVMVADDASTQQPSADNVRPETTRQLGEPSINRKPVPGQLSALHTTPVRTQSPHHVPRYSHLNAANDSDDDSPDYASTHKSDDARSERSLPKPRAGVLKTVGGPAWGSHGAPSAPDDVDIPVVDFGITRSLTPGPSRPSTAGATLGRRTPFDHAHTAPSTPPPSKPSPESRTLSDVHLDRAGHPRSPLTHSRSSSYAWQPGTVVGQQSPGRAISPEEFVQQRAAVARVPNGYVPHRSMSSGNVEQSPKKLQKNRDSLVRPSSRNSLVMDYSSTLSAREQEHVARVTGGPLINVNERSKTPDPSIGLIGAIEAREQEKRNIKEGVSGHLVQAAIAQRQQQAVERAFATPPPGYGQIDGGQNRQWLDPQPQAYWGGLPPQWPTQQQWHAQQHPQQSYQQQPYQQQPYPQQPHPQQQYPQQQQHQQRYGGFYPPQGGQGGHGGR